MTEPAPDTDLDLATRAAWLYFIGGLKQDEIADRLGISRVKVNRLISKAQRLGMVKVFVEGPAANCVALENRIIERFGLASCVVAPEIGEQALPLKALSHVGAQVLIRLLQREDIDLVGTAYGRTLVGVVDCLPQLDFAATRFVAIVGSLTRSAAAHRFDVIHELVRKTRGEGFFLPGPFFCDTVEHKSMFLAQQSLREALAMAEQAQAYLIGIGSVLPESFLATTGMITPEEHAELIDAGTVGEIAGSFIDRDGIPVDSDVNRRAISLGMERLRGREVIAIAGGKGKARAIAAALRSGVISSLVTDEQTATRLLQIEGTRSAAVRAQPQPAAG